MAFQLSPGVQVKEKDLTTVVPAVATTGAATVGAFRWGPVKKETLVQNESDLVNLFGEPDADTYEYFFTAASFLAYGNNLRVVRVVGSNALNASAEGSGTELVLIENEDDYDSKVGTATANTFIAKYPGTLGNSLKISIVDSNDFSGWNYENEFEGAPGTSPYASDKGATDDEIHVVIVDEDGKWTGSEGTILEKYAFLSKASDAKKPDGTSNYYKEVLNNQSDYVWWADHPSSGELTSNDLRFGDATVSGSKYDTLDGKWEFSFTGGVDDNANVTDAELQTGFDIFKDEQIDISLILCGPASATTSKYVIDNIADVRKDLVAFLSPEREDVVHNDGNELSDLANGQSSPFIDNLTRSSYAFADSNWKYQFDKYNDVFRWVPLNGDTGGLAVRTDRESDPWFSPAGYNRGDIKNVVKLAWNPTRTERDTLYKKGLNPVITAPGRGTVLWGDKTLLDRPSAFDRINVRRLFIVVEDAISDAAEFMLFELNDESTRSQFVNLVEPFLREVQGRRGITDYKVVCDTTNNTPAVIDRNEFVADIFIKPARSINFITLNFIATPTGVAFSEVGG